MTKLVIKSGARADPAGSSLFKSPNINTGILCESVQTNINEVVLMTLLLTLFFLTDFAYCSGDSTVGSQ